MTRRKKHTPEQVVKLLRQIEVAVANGKTTSLSCKVAEITEHPTQHHPHQAMEKLERVLS
jgi:hypothetical protein